VETKKAKLPDKSAIGRTVMKTQDSRAAMTGGSKQATTLRSGRPKWRRIILVEEDQLRDFILLRRCLGGRSLGL
jgi:hypothetical protein